jgi:hypothetical protein
MSQILLKKREGREGGKMGEEKEIIKSGGGGGDGE